MEARAAQGVQPVTKVAALLAQVAGHLYLDGLAGLDEVQEAIPPNYIRAFFRKPLDLIENPAVCCCSAC